MKENVRTFLSAICSRHIRPFISVDRLIKSAEFSEAVRFLDDHFDRNRDAGSFERLLAVLDGSKYLDSFAEHLRARHGVVVTRVSGTVKVSVPKSGTTCIENQVPRSKSISFVPHTTARTRPPTSPAGHLEPARRNTFGQRWVDQDVDALDHPARLAGSYGSGRRR